MTTGTRGHDAAQGRRKYLKQVRPAQVEQQRRLWGRWIQVASVGAAVAVIAVAGGLMLTSRQESSAATLVSAAAVPVDVGSGSTPSPTMAADMPGMDMSGSTPSPTMAADMPGMDMSGSTPSPTATMSGDMPGMDMPGMGHHHGSTPAAVSDRPLAPVLGTFGGGTAAVLLSAGLLRCKDLADRQAKKASRALRTGK